MRHRRLSEICHFYGKGDLSHKLLHPITFFSTIFKEIKLICAFKRPPETFQLYKRYILLIVLPYTLPTS